MEDQRHVAKALGRSRGQRGGHRHEARTYDVATAILEIVTGKVPLHLVCHRFLPPAQNPASARGRTRLDGTDLPTLPYLCLVQQSITSTARKYRPVPRSRTCSAMVHSTC